MGWTRGKPDRNVGDICGIGKGNAGKRSIDTNTDDGGTKGIGSGWTMGEADRPFRMAKVS